jgi:hypothetical protein
MRRGTGIALVAVVAVAACKVKHPPPPAEPEPVASVEPMPVAPPVATTPPVATSDTKPADTKPGPPIAIAPFTSPGSPGTGARALELRRDGTVLFGGKEYAKFDRDKIVDSEGSTLVRVAADGTLDGELSGADVRFVGDDLVRGDGAKFSVKDGSYVATIAGKKTVVAKVSGGQSAKRAVILVFAIRGRQDNIDMMAFVKKGVADQQSELDCLSDPTKNPASCGTPFTEPPPEPPPPPAATKKPKKR